MAGTFKRFVNSVNLPAHHSNKIWTESERSVTIGMSVKFAICKHRVCVLSRLYRNILYSQAPVVESVVFRTWEQGIAGLIPSLANFSLSIVIAKGCIPVLPLTLTLTRVM